MNNSGMIELIAKPMMVVLVFLGVFSLLVAWTNPVIVAQYNQQNGSISGTVRDNLNTIYGANVAGADTHFFDPIYTNSSTISLTHFYSVQIGHVIQDGAPITYTGTHPNNVEVSFVTETDGLHARIHESSGWVTSWDVDLYPDTIIGTDPSANSTNIEFTLNVGYTLHLHTNSSTLYDIVHDPWDTNYVVSMSTSNVNFTTSQASADILSTLGQVLTFSVPNVPMYINLILGCILVPTYILLIFFIVRSLIPTLGG
jgi:hypothetical protein